MGVISAVVSGITGVKLGQSVLKLYKAFLTLENSLNNIYITCPCPDNRTQRVERKHLAADWKTISPSIFCILLSWLLCMIYLLSLIMLFRKAIRKRKSPLRSAVLRSIVWALYLSCQKFLLYFKTSTMKAKKFRQEKTLNQFVTMVLNIDSKINVL